MQAAYGTLFRMTEDDPVTTADQRYTDLARRTAQAKQALFDLCADRVRSGLDTAETLAKPRTAFTAVTIRKALRERGVQPLPPGPKTGEEKLAALGAELSQALTEKLRQATGKVGKSDG